MLGDFAVSLDFLAAIVTLCYIAKLVFFSDGMSFWTSLPFEKRSLLNQNVVRRA